MRKDLEQLFARLASPEPPSGLLHSIMDRIRFEQERRAFRRHLLFSSSTALASAGTFSLTMSIIGREFDHAGFLPYLSLLFSDFQALLPHWQDFTLVLLESLPTTGLLLLLLTTLTMLWSSKLLAKALHSRVWTP